MKKRSSASATVYQRGAIESGFLRDEYEQYLRRAASDGPNPETELVYTYFDHQVVRLINLYILSGSRGVESLTSLLETIVRLAYRIMLTRDRRQLKTCDDIRVVGSIRHYAIDDPKGAHIELGVEGKSEPGKSIVLGVSTSDEVPRLELAAEVSAQQLRSLRKQPDVLHCIMNAFEDAVPLHLDFSLGVRVRTEDQAFRLASSESAASGVETSQLGITTMLGAG